MSSFYHKEPAAYISIDKLLLWPDNPRLKFGDFKHYNLTPQELSEEKTQANLLNYLQKDEHKLNDLIESIQRNGFSNSDPLIVVFQEEINKYYVIEGNRRLASVKSINENGGEQIDQLPCCKFIHKKGGVDFKSAINLCVAESHYLGGKKDHSGIQKAKVIYEIYWTFLNEETNFPRYRYDLSVIKKTGSFLGGLTANEVKKEISIARIYDQLIELNYAVDHKRRERLSWVFDNNKLFYDQFGFKADDNLRLSNSIESFYNLFIAPDCPVSNPTKLSYWIFVLKHKKFHQGLINLMINDPNALERIYFEFKGWTPDGGAGINPSTTPRPGIAKGINKILKSLEKIKVDSYVGSKSEDAAIEELVTIVNNKFQRLLYENIKEPSTPDLSTDPGAKNFVQPADPDQILGQFGQLT